MGGARAVVASVGASISLVAGAVLSLLVGFVFAFDGLTGGLDERTTSVAIEVRALPDATGAPSRPGAAPVVIERAPPAAPRAKPALAASAGESVRQRSDRQSSPATSSGVASIGPARSTAPPAAPPPVAVAAPASGDAVRDAGDTVTSTVATAGGVVAGVTTPLGPPVSQAVQDVIDLVVALLQGATDGVAGTLDSTLP